MPCLPRQYKMWVSHYDSRLAMASATLRVGFWGSLKPDNVTRSERKRRSTCYLLIRGPRKMFTNAEGTLHLSPFVFITCQYQTENLIKGWMQSSVPQAKFAFSRPGLLTFKIEGQTMVAAEALPRCPFIRSFGWSGEMISGTLDEVAPKLESYRKQHRAGYLHVWERDSKRVGDRGFEPFAKPEWEAWGAKLLALGGPNWAGVAVNRSVPSGEKVLDLIQVDPDRWLLGFHVAASTASSWVGGAPPVISAKVISRAYYKIKEAMLWSELPVQSGQHALELGAAPGGACQYMLEQGLQVIGVDPAEMSPEILSHPKFEHWRMRASDIRKRRLGRVDWLVCDSNVAPQHTLDTVEGITTNQHVQCRGLILTLKMPDWKLAEHLPNYLQRVKSWGFPFVTSRHLAFNRQEICVIASKTLA